MFGTPTAEMYVYWKIAQTSSTWPINPQVNRLLAVNSIVGREDRSILCWELHHKISNQFRNSRLTNFGSSWTQIREITPGRILSDWNPFVNSTKGRQPAKAKLLMNWPFKSFSWTMKHLFKSFFNKVFFPCSGLFQCWIYWVYSYKFNAQKIIYGNGVVQQLANEFPSTGNNWSSHWKLLELRITVCTRRIWIRNRIPSVGT